jgi:DNA-binding transcriptional LysR family regulator
VAAAYVLPRLAAELKTTLPGMSIDVHTEVPEVMERQLLTGEIDFFLSRFPPEGVSPAIEVEWFDKTVPNAIVRRSHPLATGFELDPFDLRHFPKVAFRGFKETISRIPDTARRSCYQPNIAYDVFGTFYEFALDSDLVIFGGFDTVPDGFVKLEIPAEDAVYMVGDVAIFRMEGRTPSPTARRVEDIVRRRYAELSLSLLPTASERPR